MYLALNLGLLLLTVDRVPLVQAHLALPGHEQQEVNLHKGGEGQHHRLIGKIARHSQKR